MYHTFQEARYRSLNHVQNSRDRHDSIYGDIDARRKVARSGFQVAKRGERGGEDDRAVKTVDRGES
jgi:hypothetical protein